LSSRFCWLEFVETSSRIGYWVLVTQPTSALSGSRLCPPFIKKTVHSVCRQGLSKKSSQRFICPAALSVHRSIFLSFVIYSPLWRSLLLRWSFLTSYPRLLVFRSSIPLVISFYRSFLVVYPLLQQSHLSVFSPFVALQVILWPSPIVYSSVKRLLLLLHSLLFILHCLFFPLHQFGLLRPFVLRPLLLLLRPLALCSLFVVSFHIIYIFSFFYFVYLVGHHSVWLSFDESSRFGRYIWFSGYGLWVCAGSEKHSPYSEIRKVGSTE